MMIPHVPHVSAPLALLASAAIAVSVALHAGEGTGCASGTPSPSNIAAGALTAEGIACAVDTMVASALPSSSLASAFVTEIMGACKAKIPQSLTSAVEALVAVFLSPPSVPTTGAGALAFRTRLDALRAGARR